MASDRPAKPTGHINQMDRSSIRNPPSIACEDIEQRHRDEGHPIQSWNLTGKMAPKCPSWAILPVNYFQYFHVINVWSNVHFPTQNVIFEVQISFQNFIIFVNNFFISRFDFTVY